MLIERQRERVGVTDVKGKQERLRLEAQADDLDVAQLDDRAG